HPEVRDNSDPRRHLEIKKSRFRLPMTYALELKEDKTWKLTGRVGASLKFEGTANNRIVEFLGLNRGTLYTNQELGEILTLSENTIRVATGGLQSERLIECCRGQGKAKFYYIPDDTLPNGYQLQAKNRSSDAIASLSDREKIAEAITPESSPPETIERIDHETAKNDLDFSENPEKKCDLTIDSPETSVPPESGSDPSSDPEAIASPETPAPSKSECDRGVDRSRSPRSLPAIGATVGIFEEGEYVLIQVTGHHEDVVVGYAEDNRRFEVLVDLCCEPVIRDRAGVQLKVGDKVHYVGDDQRLAKVSKSETLTIKSFRYGWVRAGGKNWGSRLTNHPAHEFEKARRS
ncbi:MAG: hypothetical protein SAJ12_13585, partial [Jaaginema sp. PMC 1079.18]|nr:hypothetical protein [Jaaginema sp. PMC 1079.18]